MNVKAYSVLAISIFSSSIFAFNLDKSSIDTAVTLNISTIHSVEDKAKAWIEPEKLSMCRSEGGELRIARSLPVNLEKSRSDASFELSKGEFGIDVDFGTEQIRMQRNLYRSLAYKVSSSERCRGDVGEYLPVNHIFGASSLSQLLSMSENFVVTPQTKLANKRLDGNVKPSSNWFAAVENDDEGTLSKVTFSQSDKTQHTLLEVSCEALELTLSVAVNDFLGNNSQNAMLRFDQDKFKPVRLTLTDNSRGFLFNDSPDIFAKIHQAQELSLRYTNFNGVSKTLHYPLEDLDAKLLSYPALCGVK